MLEHGPVKITKEYDSEKFEPIKATRVKEQLICILSMTSQDKKGASTEEILKTLHLKKDILKNLFRRVPSLPKPYDWKE